MSSSAVSQAGKEELRRAFHGLDPFDLRQAIEAKLRAIFRLARTSRKGSAKLRRRAQAAARSAAI